MRITLDIAEDLAAQIIPVGKDPAQAALEALAVEGYRTERLSESEVRRMLGYETRMEVHALLASHSVNLHYTDDNLAHDIAASDLLHAQRASVIP